MFQMIPQNQKIQRHETTMDKQESLDFKIQLRI